MSPTIVLDVLAVFSVFAVGLIAGQMLAIAIANYAAKKLPEASWTLRFQAENTVFTSTMPPFLMAPTAGLVGLRFLTEGDARWMFVLANVLILIVLAVTMAVNVPINTEVKSWTAGAAPPTWTATRDRWLRFHALRTLAGLVSFAVATMGLRAL
jgi:uncharacterized membrane protein